MASFDFITSRLATGGAITNAADVQALVAVGINTIIDCREAFDDGPLLAGVNGMHYLWNPTKDDGLPKPTAWFQSSLTFALPLFAIPKAKIYCHCREGINRGPSTAYAIMLALGWSKELARVEIIKARPQCAVGIRYADDAERAVKVLGYC